MRKPYNYIVPIGVCIVVAALLFCGYYRYDRRRRCDHTAHCGIRRRFGRFRLDDTHRCRFGDRILDSLLGVDTLFGDARNALDVFRLDRRAMDRRDPRNGIAFDRAREQTQARRYAARRGENDACGCVKRKIRIDKRAQNGCIPRKDML